MRRTNAIPMAFFAEIPLKTASDGVAARRPRHGRMESDGAAREERLAARAHLGLRSPSGVACALQRIRRKPSDGSAPASDRLSYRELAEKLPGLRGAYGLHAYRTAAHHGASVWRIVGLSGHRLLRAHLALSALPMISATSSTAAISPGCVTFDWSRCTFRATRTDCGASTAPRFTSTKIRARRASRMGHADLQLRRNEVKTFLLSNALFWLKEFHLDGLRVDAVASMLYLIIRANPASGFPTAMEGGESGGRPLRRQRAGASGAGRDHDRRGMHCVGGVSKLPRIPELAGIHLLSGTWAGCTTCSIIFPRIPCIASFIRQNITFSMLYAFTENFVLPISHDEVVHGKGSLVSKMPGDEWQRVRQRPGVSSRTCMGIRGRSHCSAGCEIGQTWEI